MRFFFNDKATTEKKKIDRGGRGAVEIEETTLAPNSPRSLAA